LKTGGTGNAATEFIRETRKSFTAHFIKQRMATPVNLVSVERTGAAGLPMPGGQVECESSEDTAHMKENVWDHGDPDYESIQFAEEQLLVAIPDALERERAKQMIRTLLRKHHDSAKAAWLASGKTSGRLYLGATRVRCGTCRQNYRSSGSALFRGLSRSARVCVGFRRSKQSCSSGKLPRCCSLR
jgi:hypothetical protein